MQKPFFVRIPFRCFPYRDIVGINNIDNFIHT